MANGRCRMHGGKSTGPRTAEGIERIRKAHTVHGRYSAEMRELRRVMAAWRCLARNAVRAVE
ncbi:MAG TPA: HGGxSTG domain-containing protein [Acetobacteraceae bacterium]|nr:HGGxSTG domain-containing protein [Acetobacteraceae bacterium]